MSNPHKRQRTEEADPSAELTLYNPDDQPPQTETFRTSTLSHPTMKLTGHKGSVYALAYSPDGEYLLSSSFDMTCLLWNASGDCENINVLSGHKNAVLDVAWTSDGENILTASADKTIAFWDGHTCERIRRFKGDNGHTAIVNDVDVSPAASSLSNKLFVSASDDGLVKLWDARVKGTAPAMSTFDCEFPVTSVVFGMDGHSVYSAGIDNCITAWDLRTGDKSMMIKAHSDTITSLALHPKGTHLLSNSMDSTMKSWDIRPFVPDGTKRHCKTFVGATHNAEKGLLNCAWSSDGNMVTGGSADKVVHIWDEMTSEELYYLPGHKGCVNSVVFHPTQNVIASSSSDKSIYVGELSN